MLVSPPVSNTPPALSRVPVTATLDAWSPTARTVPPALYSPEVAICRLPLLSIRPPVLSIQSLASSTSGPLPVADSEPPAVVRVAAVIAMFHAWVVAPVRSMSAPSSRNDPLLRIVPSASSRVLAFSESRPVPAWRMVPSVLTSTLALSDMLPPEAISPSPLSSVPLTSRSSEPSASTVPPPLCNAPADTCARPAMARVPLVLSNRPPMSTRLGPLPAALMVPPWFCSDCADSSSAPLPAMVPWVLSRP